MGWVTAAAVSYPGASGAPLAVREPDPSEPRPPRLLDRVRAALRARHASRRTEKAYVAWIRRYVLFHGKRHPAEMGAAELAQFLSSLAVERNVAASKQNQALSALLFLALHLERVKQQHEGDLRRSAGWVELSWALARKYPNAGRDWGWQWVFPATRTYIDRATGQQRRHHLHEPVLQPHLPPLVRDATARGRPRHPHVQELLGNRDVSTTMIYTHVLNRGPAGVRSPADRMLGS